MKSAELFARRLAATRTRIEPTVLARLSLDADIREYAGGDAIFPAAANATGALMLASGIAGEARVLADGRRQILGLRFPGDMLKPNAGDLVVALTRVKVAGGPRLTACLVDPSADFQPLRRAWLATEWADQALLRDQVVRLGRMSAFERMAHLLLETHERLAQVGLAQGGTFHLPLTQEVVSDVLGLSVVHLNRTLQALRREGLVVTRRSYVTLPDRDRLVSVAAYVSRFPTPWRAPAEEPAPRLAMTH